MGLLDTIRYWNSDCMIAFERGRVRVDWIQPREEWAPFAESESERTAWLDAAVARFAPGSA